MRCRDVDSQMPVVKEQDDFDREMRPAELGGVLDRAESLLESCLDSQSPLLARLSNLRERLVHQRLQIAVLGQFKRGKSTFVNALLGAPLLPSAVVPVTAIPTFITWRAKPLARVSFSDIQKMPEECGGAADQIRDFLYRFVAEEANPQNRLGVAKAELFYPAPILSGGTVLIDTPGVGSTLKHNTDAALRALSECDAALFVIATDPPITEIELDYLDQLRSKVSRIFIIVNKVDTVAAEDRDALVKFLSKVLRERSLLSEEGAIFQVSARDGLAAKLKDDRGGLERSGVTEIEEHLLRYLATEKTQSLEQAIAIKTADLLAQAASMIELRLQALRMPLDELGGKTRAFEDALHSIEEQRRVTGDLLAGDNRRLIEDLEARIEELREKSRSQLAGVIDGSLAGLDPSAWEETAQREIAVAIETIFEGAREQIARACSTGADAVLSAYQMRTDELIATVRRTAAELFDISFREDIDRDSFALGEDPYWVTEDIGSALIPDPSKLADRLLPIGLRRRHLRARLIRNTDQLIVRNAENLRWAALRGFNETFRNASGHLEERLDDAIDATRSVIEKAAADRRDTAFATDPEISRLDGILHALVETIDGLGLVGKMRLSERA
jgi:GTP-binding protein EngB required for normal cell division